MRTHESTHEALVKVLNQYQSLCIAYSGGVDSTLLLSVAAQSHPGRVTVVIGTGDFVPERETDEAVAFSRSIGIEPVIIHIDFLGNPLVASNSTDRCFHCKHMIFEEILKVAAARGAEAVMDGTNADDLGDYRPGLRALRALNVISPFCEAGISKAQIRELARARSLPVWDKPASACLASRIPTGDPLRKETLKAIELGENLLRDLGFKQYRVRVHDDLARIEVHPDDFAALLTHRQQITDELKILGFRYVAMDMEGYKTGNMNREEDL